MFELIKRFTCTVVAVGGALFATGCQAPMQTAPAAAPVAEAAAPRLLPAAARRRLLAAGPSVGKLWGLAFHDAQKLYAPERRVPAGHSGEGGLLINRYGFKWYFAEDLGWRVTYDFAGDGEVAHVGDARFVYTVPAGRVLVLNRVEMPTRVRVNGFRLGLPGTQRSQQVEALDYVFGPGELVVLQFEYGKSADSSAAISGVTADPALLGGALPAGLAEGSK